MSIEFRTLNPGLLVSLKTSMAGNIRYRRKDIEANSPTQNGGQTAKWETEREIFDVAEYELATRVRGKARSIITGVCSATSFGLLCPQGKEEVLDVAIAESRKLADQFNAAAKKTKIGIYVIVGRIAADDEEAVRAVNSEVTDLIAEMTSGVKNLDVKTIRDAANKARSIAPMLSPAAAAPLQEAINAARAAAKQINADEGAAKVDNLALAKLNVARTAFIELDDAPLELSDGPKAPAKVVEMEGSDAV